MRPKAEWVIDSEAMRGRGIIFFNNFISQRNAIQPPLFWFSKPALFATSGLYREYFMESAGVRYLPMSC